MLNIFFSPLILLASCAKTPLFNGDYTKIEIGPGPEDIALDTIQGMERIIA